MKKNRGYTKKEILAILSIVLTKIQNITKKLECSIDSLFKL